MRPLIVIAVAAAAALSLIAADGADAKRLGGGRSLGTQRSITPTPPAASSPSGAASNPVMPAQPGVAAARPAAAGAAAAPSGASRWLGPIAGIAAGLGLAALMSHFGLSESFGSLLLVALLVFAGFFVVRLLFARKGAAQAVSPLRYGSVGSVSGIGSASDRFRSASDVSNDAPPQRIEPTWGDSARAQAPAAPRALPAGFDPIPFLHHAKLQFRNLQSANDRGDRQALMNVMTPALFREIAGDIDNRIAHVPTDVVALDAEMLDVATEDRRHVASVRFTGALREDGAAEAKPFVEIWNLEKPVDGSTGWLLSGIQQVEENAAAQ